MTAIRYCAAALLLAGATATWGQSQFWGELKAGKFPVGFRSAYQLDIARSYDADYPVPGLVALKKPRPIFLAVWYPAAAEHDVAMAYRDYFKALTADSPVPEFAQRLRTFTRDTAARYMLGKPFEKLNDEERVAWEGLLATPVFATMNVPAAPGKFPVVIYHPGIDGTFEDNSVACEFLASHGYVVLSSAYQAADSSNLHIDSDLATSLEDLSFILRYAAALPFADLSRVAAMGHGLGAQAMLAWRARPNSPLDAVVALDSTVAYRPLAEFADLKAALDRNPSSTVPALLFADRRRTPRFENFAPYLKFAPYYEATLDDLDHNDFVSQSAAAKSEDVRRRYEAVCDLTLRFLDGHLKGDADALVSLRAPAPAGLLQSSYKPPRPVPPTSAQVVKLYSSEEPASLDTLSALVRQNDADLPVDAAAMLADSGRKRECVSLLKWAAPLLPHSADLQRALGAALFTMGDRAGSRAAFEKALLLLPDDVTLDTSQKIRTKKAVEEGLESLRKQP
jgi:dienelactone hydrolase